MLYARAHEGAPRRPHRPAAAGKVGRRHRRSTRFAVGDAPARGGNQPKVTIVEFSDFQCPYCGRARRTREHAAQGLRQRHRIVYRHNPLPFHDNAMPAALAAEAARAQGKFWEMHDKLFAGQQNLDRAIC